MVLLCTVSCSKINNSVPEEGIVFSTQGYTVSVTDAQVKASNAPDTAFLYDNGQFLDGTKNGGFFRVEAYGHGLSEEYFTAPTTVKYHTDVQQGAAKEWRIYNPKN